MQNSGGVERWQIDHLRGLARKTLVYLYIKHLATYNFGWVKYWRMTFVLPNSPKFSPTKTLHHTVAEINLTANKHTPGEVYQMLFTPMQKRLASKTSVSFACHYKHTCIGFFSCTVPVVC